STVRTRIRRALDEVRAKLAARPSTDRRRWLGALYANAGLAPRVWIARPVTWTGVVLMKAKWIATAVAALCACAVWMSTEIATRGASTRAAGGARTNAAELAGSDAPATSAALEAPTESPLAIAAPSASSTRAPIEPSKRAALEPGRLMLHAIDRATKEPIA